MASCLRVMEKPIQLQQQHPQHQQQHQAHEKLKCPRCDSSNTKFCYYNNYSLSQPRHFCKACKRYWTRGGTLRNVPVGGGCRKNKRVKRPITTTVHTAPTPPLVNHHTNTSTNPNPNLDHNQVPSSCTTSNTNTNHPLNPLFYGLLPQNPNFPQFQTMASRVNETLVSRYDLLQQHMNASGFCFSSSTTSGGSIVANHGSHAPNLNLSSYNSSMYGGASTSSSTSAPTMSSLFVSSLNQQPRFTGFATYDTSSIIKDLKMEETQNRMEWNDNQFHGRNKNDQSEGVVFTDPNSLLWDTDGGGWIDQTNNIGSSVSSLI